MNDNNRKPDGHGLKRALGFWSGVALVVGVVIGAGIFRTPASIATVLQDPLLILGLWVFFGVVSMCGALTLAELATMMPRTGGTYVYLRAAYGDAAAFVFGWLYLLVAVPAGMAALSVFFGELIFGLFGGLAAAGTWGIPAVAIFSLTALSLANILGVRSGSAITNFFTFVKVGALVIFIVAAFVSGQGDSARWTVTPEGAITDGGLAAAAKSVLFTYNGWIYVSLVAGEMIDPERRLTRIIVGGTGAIMALYIAANLAYIYLIPLPAMPGTVVANEGMNLLFGPIGGTLMTLCILGSVFGTLNGVILTKARVAFALARDKLSFAFLGRAHATRATPYTSILIQASMGILLVLVLHEPEHPLRLFDRLTAYFILVEWLALIFAIGAVFVLRRKMADAVRPYRTPFYPWVPLFFIVATVVGLSAVVWSSCSRGDYAPLVGLAVVIAGFPVHHLWKRSTKASA